MSGSRSRRGGVAAAAALVVAAAVGGFALWQRNRVAGPGDAGDKPSVAVLYFENNTGNPQLDWLRTGLTDMLVTDLSQSPDVEVLGTDRLVQILTQMKRQDDRQISFDTVQELAKRAGVRNVILGSYVKAGETIRINLKLQEATTGRIVTAERVESIGEANLFPTVDDLTRRIKAKFAPGGNASLTKTLINPPTAVADNSSPPLSLDRDLKDVSTSSIEAYRYYVEGIDLHNRAREFEALPLLEKAVATDPTFAMALTKLAVVESNLGHPLKREEYSKRAMEHLDRLSPRERYYIEGYYYSNKADGFGKAIQSYKTAIDLYPDFASARHNLALLYSQLGRESDAVPLYEELRRRKMAYPTTYTNLAAVYRNLGQFDKSYEVLREYLDANPTVPQAHRGMGDLLAVWGKYDEALGAYDKALALSPGDLSFMASKRAVYIVTERWDDLEATNAKLTGASDPLWRASALISTATQRLYQGRSADALKLLDQGISTLGSRGSVQTAGPRLQIAGLLMDKGQNAAALASAQRALEDANGIGPLSYQSLAVIEQLHIRLGHTKEAAAAREELAKRNAQLPSDDLREFAKHLQNGALASDRHDTATAIAEWKLAEGRARPGNSNTDILFELASAFLDAKDDAQAAPRLERIVTSGLLRATQPMPFVRSLYLLGQISERKGDRAKATEYYRRFLKYWGTGDMDRQRVADALARLGLG